MGSNTEDGYATGAGYAGLGRVDTALCNRVLEEKQITEVTLDADHTFIFCDKEEAVMTYKGKKGFGALLAFIAETEMCLYDRFQAGNISPSARPLGCLKKCQESLHDGRRITALRSDSAWYRADVFNHCERESIGFAITADLDRAVGAAIQAIPEEDWGPLFDRDGIKTDREIAETVHTMNGTKKSFRLIAQRWEKERIQTLFGERIIYGYHVIATNREESAPEVVYWHNQRGRCENWIKEEKLGFGTAHLPCGQLGANAVFFRIGVLSYNLAMAMKLLVLPKAYRTKQSGAPLRTIPAVAAKSALAESARWQLYQWAGYLAKHSGQIALKLSAPLKLIRLLEKCRYRCWLLSTA